MHSGQRGDGLDTVEEYVDALCHSIDATQGHLLTNQSDKDGTQNGGTKTGAFCHAVATLSFSIGSSPSYRKDWRHTDERIRVGRVRALSPAPPGRPDARRSPSPSSSSRRQQKKSDRSRTPDPFNFEQEWVSAETTAILEESRPRLRKECRLCGDRTSGASKRMFIHLLSHYVVFYCLCGYQSQSKDTDTGLTIDTEQFFSSYFLQSAKFSVLYQNCPVMSRIIDLPLSMPPLGHPLKQPSFLRFDRDYRAVRR